MVERDRPSQWTIDGAIDGRAAGTVSYTLKPDANGTQFERTFSYRSPTLWFALLNAALLREKIQAESEQAVARLKSNLEAP